jgi:hypothetical protein
MSNSFVELAVQSGGDKLDMELLTIASQNVKRQRGQVTGGLELEIAAVKNAPMASNLYGLGTREITGRATIASVFSAQVLNATQFANSSAIDTDAYRVCNFFLNVIRTANPTGEFKIVPQFSDDNGTDWFEARDFVITFIDLTEFPTSVGKNLCYQIPILAPDMRFRIEASDTDGTNTLTVTMSQELTT